MTLKHEFVEFIPDELDKGTIYISVVHKTALHTCVCGCGREVVTPISPTDWQLTFDGESVSLYPSIGNWSFPCRSHYWIKRGEVIWAPAWSNEEVSFGRRHNFIRKNEYYEKDQVIAACKYDGGLNNNSIPLHRKVANLWQWFRRIRSGRK